MKSRGLTKEDYNTLCEWWKFWRFTPPIIQMLPDDGLGGIMITDEDDNPLAAGFIYDTNSYICWIEYIVANPKVSKELRREGVDELLNKLKYLCKEKNYLLAFSSIRNPSLLERYKECGWQLGTQNTNEMVLNLWG